MNKPCISPQWTSAQPQSRNCHWCPRRVPCFHTCQGSPSTSLAAPLFVKTTVQLLTAYCWTSCIAALKLNIKTSFSHDYKTIKTCLGKLPLGSTVYQCVCGLKCTYISVHVCLSVCVCVHACMLTCAWVCMHAFGSIFRTTPLVSNCTSAYKLYLLHTVFQAWLCSNLLRQHHHHWQQAHGHQLCRSLPQAQSLWNNTNLGVYILEY